MNLFQTMSQITKK